MPSATQLSEQKQIVLIFRLKGQRSRLSDTKSVKRWRISRVRVYLCAADHAPTETRRNSTDGAKYVGQDETWDMSTEMQPSNHGSRKWLIIIQQISSLELVPTTFINYTISSGPNYNFCRLVCCFDVWKPLPLFFGMTVITNLCRLTY